MLSAHESQMVDTTSRILEPDPMTLGCDEDTGIVVSSDSWTSGSVESLLVADVLVDESSDRGQ